MRRQIEEVINPKLGAKKNILTLTLSDGEVRQGGPPQKNGTDMDTDFNIKDSNALLSDTNLLDLFLIN